MKNTDQTEPTMLDFFEGIPEQVPVSDGVEISFKPEDFSGMMTEAIYILDFQKRSFHYIADHGFFLSGYSREEAMNAGYKFFHRVIHPADISLWAKMHSVIIKKLNSHDLQIDCINYFSCTFQIKSSLQIGAKPSYLMAYQKLKPQWHEGQVRFGICLLSSSVVRHAGNLRIYYKNCLDYDEYSFQNQRWIRQKEIPKLTDREKEILKLSKQGKSSKEIADILCISGKTIRNIETGLYQKLSVHSMIEAIIFSTNHQMIFE
ncbi:MAG: LuxR C-terminal-related transcriptional regulator [Tannerellaceae bacterium]|nr:LuxR C-terminal-related transcriptional regulator [Tannerellaceae bacterium]